ncbi:unnamed protein product [Caenorhabditis bovis]|uniref:Phosphoribosylformylglycinamidine cyclo-ligase n=1 Tax=Caenorhabditis bovis TaxID=2654633 RepID=A0A8S1EGB9_9PELO|nr:unnamed protein product [Caenorhabditis bovis]
MNILIIGNGGREHALLWKLQQSSEVGSVFVAPGNGGTELNVDIRSEDIDGICTFCTDHNIKLIIIGPEVPLANGIVDEINQRHLDLMVFGPSMKGAMLEASKVYAKNFMKLCKIETADFVIVSNEEELDDYFKKKNKFKNCVIKADGLAGGKGVFIAKDLADAKIQAKAILKGKFGNAGDKIVIEEKLEGYEVSALAFCDGKSFSRMPLVQDHKRLLNNDLGPNTGGMGVVAPIQVSAEINDKIDTLFEKTLQGLNDMGIFYCGIIYAGIMIIESEPYLLEYNCRFGDPETQVLMRLLESDLYDVIISSYGVVLASSNYPNSGDFGAIITIVTNGGRIFCITVVDSNFKSCQDVANKVANIITFPGKQFRTDIGQKMIAMLSCSPLTSISYAESGVNVEEGNQFVDNIKQFVQKTLQPGTYQIGGFGAMIDLRAFNFSYPQLVIGMDGVGTKIEVATKCQNFTNIGYDVVAMCVNDVLCHCARPIAFLDYYVCGRLNRTAAAVVVESVAAACIEAGCSLIGGETAEMPGVYNTEQWDIAGCAIACRESHWPTLPLTSKIREEDIVIGLSSSGLHSNGFSLLRTVMKKNGVKYTDNVPWDNNITFGEILLRPTRIYIKNVLPLLKDGKVLACAHITGGGLVENSIRVFDKDTKLKININCTSWKPPEIFQWIASAGPVNSIEMLKTFNCGIGLMLIVPKSASNQILKYFRDLDEAVSVLGNVEYRSEKESQINLINHENLFDYSKYRSQLRKVRVALLISGRGTNMQKLIERSKCSDSNCEIVVVISNKSDALGLQIASQMGVATKFIPHTKDRVSGEKEVVKCLKSYKAEMICLAGYMRMSAIQDALSFGAKVTGCTVHFVDEFIDHGDIIAQRAVPIKQRDTLETLQKRIQEQEHIIFPEAMISVAQNILKEDGYDLL